MAVVSCTYDYLKDTMHASDLISQGKAKPWRKSQRRPLLAENNRAREELETKNPRRREGNYRAVKQWLW